MTSTFASVGDQGCKLSSDRGALFRFSPVLVQGLQPVEDLVAMEQVRPVKRAKDELLGTCVVLRHAFRSEGPVLIGPRKMRPPLVRKSIHQVGEKLCGGMAQWYGTGPESRRAGVIPRRASSILASTDSSAPSSLRPGYEQGMHPTLTTFGPHERRPHGAFAASALPSAMGEAGWLSISRGGFESHREYPVLPSMSGQVAAASLRRGRFNSDGEYFSLSVKSKRKPGLGPFIAGPGRANHEQRQP